MSSSVVVEMEIVINGEDLVARFQAMCAGIWTDET